MHARARNSAAAGAEELELTIHRTFDAPRALVFRAWTEPQHLARWSCPRGFTMMENRGELRVGGGFSAWMRSPEGEDHRLRGVYREIAPPERLVFTHSWLDASGAPGPETLVTVTLAERDGRTEMTFHQAGFGSVASRDGHERGWASSFELLTELLAKVRRDVEA
ncbi:MAG TPA: SRPBCC domain-containing protein [Steroidobacteraceae bacterium]|nr:SRPBCC domain-containing protein [Steroidobacteraceae bacterium]